MGEGGVADALDPLQTFQRVERGGPPVPHVTYCASEPSVQQHQGWAEETGPADPFGSPDSREAVTGRAAFGGPARRAMSPHEYFRH